MRIVVIGAVAAGTSAAAKARRNDKQAEIVIYERDQDISYSGCGLPYYIGGEIQDIGVLTPRDSAYFMKKYNVDVKIRHEVQAIDAENQTVSVKNMMTGEVFSDRYDKLVVATGAKAFVPPVGGTAREHVFFLRTAGNAVAIRRFIEQKQPQKAVIAGTGFIGFEVLENLTHRGIDVTILEVADQITPNLDRDMAEHLEQQLKQRGVKILKSTRLESIRKDEVVLSTGESLSAELVIMATGVRPNTRLAIDAGVKLGKTGAIQVDSAMRTNLENIYACGDCIETFSVITGKPVYRPMGSTANKTGRIAGDVLSGGTSRYRGNLSTGIFKLFDLVIASTGLSEKEARKEGYEAVVSRNSMLDRPDYMGGKKMMIKAIADQKTGRLLGVQIIGTQGVDKRMDVFVALITGGALVDELFHLDLAYAPPFATAKDPIHYTGMILESAIRKSK